MASRPGAPRADAVVDADEVVAGEDGVVAVCAAAEGLAADEAGGVVGAQCVGEGAGGRGEEGRGEGARGALCEEGEAGLELEGEVGRCGRR